MLAQIVKSKRTPIGLDLGETALRAAQLRKTPGGFCVTSLAHLDRTQTPANATKSPPDSLEDGLRKLFSHSAFLGRSVIPALNPPEVEFHVLDVPAAALQGDETAQNLLHWEIGRLTSLSADQVETRHWLLPSRPGGTASAIGVSARRDAVMTLLDHCQRGRLRCSCIETGATALHRFGRLLRSWGEDEIWGLLDLGARQTRLILCLGHAPLLIRHTGEGGTSWTERIAEVLHLQIPSAEIHKKSHGIALQGRRESRAEADSAPSDEVAVMLLSALRSELNEMAAEIKRSYEYVLNGYPGRRAADLVLVGGGANMPNLPEFLSGILGINVRRCSAYASDPNCRIRLESAVRHPLEDFATAIGLAMSE